MSFKTQMAEQRARDLLPLAWAKGIQSMQRGWWPYVSSELDKLEQDALGIKQRFTDQLKAKRNEAGHS